MASNGIVRGRDTLHLVQTTIHRTAAAPALASYPPAGKGGGCDNNSIALRICIFEGWLAPFALSCYSLPAIHSEIPCNRRRRFNSTICWTNKCNHRIAIYDYR